MPTYLENRSEGWASKLACLDRKWFPCQAWLLDIQPLVSHAATPRTVPTPPRYAKRAVSDNSFPLLQLHRSISLPLRCLNLTWRATDSYFIRHPLGICDVFIRGKSVDRRVVNKMRCRHLLLPLLSNLVRLFIHARYASELHEISGRNENGYIELGFFFHRGGKSFPSLPPSPFVIQRWDKARSVFCSLQEGFEIGRL